MELRLTDTAKEDIRFFLKSGQTGIVKKIEKLLTSIKETPFTGIGKPEPLKHEYTASGREESIKSIVLYTILKMIL